MLLANKSGEDKANKLADKREQEEATQVTQNKGKKLTFQLTLST